MNEKARKIGPVDEVFQTNRCSMETLTGLLQLDARQCALIIVRLILPSPLSIVLTGELRIQGCALEKWGRASTQIEEQPPDTKSGYLRVAI